LAFECDPERVADKERSDREQCDDDNGRSFPTPALDLAADSVK